jgi:hypothetical protein
MLRALAIFLLLCSAAHSEERGPRESESKTEAAQPDNQHGATAQQPSAQATPAAAPIINVYTSKHAGEESHCAKPKDWKEWPSFAWCKADTWLDAERIIAVFTVILGIATWLLWRATKNLVEGAERNAGIQLRAYVFAGGCRLTDFAVGKEIAATVTVKNTGQTPAYDVVVITGLDFRVLPLASPIGLDEIPTDLSKISVGPGQELFPRIFSGKVLGVVEDEALRDGRAVIYVHGRIEYRTAFGDHPMTEFKFFFDDICARSGRGVMRVAVDGNKAT